MRNKYNRLDGDEDFKLSADGLTKDPYETYKAATQEKREQEYNERMEEGSKRIADRANKQGGNADGWFGIGNSILNNLGGIFSGIGSIVGASKGTPQNAYYIEEKDNSGIGTYLIIGGVVLAVVVVVIVLVARK